MCEGGTLAEIGPFFAGTVALLIALGAAAGRRYRRPSLSLVFDANNSLNYLPGVGTVHGTDSHWIRLRVENGTGKRSADDVEVLVVELKRTGSQGSAPFGGVPLVWSNLNIGNDMVTRVTLPPGVPRFVDACALVEPRPQAPGGPSAVSGQSAAPVELQVWPPPADRRHQLDAGKHEVVLALSARDTKATFYRLKIEHDGKWWDEAAVKDHLHVSLENSSKP